MLDAGNFKLRQGLLELIAGIALNNVEGASGTGIRLEHPEDARKRKHLAKGIKAELADSRLLFNLEVNMDYGRDFTEIGKAIQQEIKSSVEAMTDWPVEAVNINVVGVNEL